MKMEKIGENIVSILVAIIIAILWDVLVLGAVLSTYPSLESLLSLTAWIMPSIALAVATYIFEADAKLGVVNVFIYVAVTMLITRLMSGGLDAQNIALNYVLYIPIALIAYFATWAFIAKVK